MAKDPWSEVLWVDDDPMVLNALSVVFPGGGFAENAFNAIALLHHRAILGKPWAVLVADVRMPGMDGVQLCARAREVSPNTRRVLLSAHWSDLDADRAVNEAGAEAVLTKPIDVAGISKTLETMIARRRASDSSQTFGAVDPERERAAAQARENAREALLACTSVKPPK